MRNVVWGGAVLALATWITAAASMQPAAASIGEPTGTLREMVETERAFVRAAQDTNWRDAFLAYFADGITGFEGEDIKERLRKQPAPPKDLELWWEPRAGDIAASGEIGWLTGPVRTRRRDDSAAILRYSSYTSIWKRQPDGTFKVILDVGIDLPAEAPFAEGFTRVGAVERYAGDERGKLGKPSLLEADGQLTGELKTTSPAAAYARALAPLARIHRHGILPAADRTAALAWAGSQPSWSAGEARFAHVSESGDLGYTWGSYAVSGTDGKGEERGHYVRLWSRDARGRWRVVLDITQPKREQPAG